MYPRDTIAALATAPGPAAVAVVRVSGADAARVAARVFRGTAPDRWRARRLYLGQLVDRQGRALDQGLGVIMRAPRSYTGEDVVELHCHGGAVLARGVLAAVIAAGARSAERGEFTLRAFLNGKLDLVQAEAVADLISAPNERAARIAAGHLGGALSEAVDALRERLIGIAANLEAAIDFSDENVGQASPAKLADEASEIAGILEELAASHAQGRILREGVRVAIVGKPNVGKSSLLNRLLGSDRAIVTPIAGTTRDVIEERLDLEGVAVVLVDTAGLREDGDEVERLGMVRSRKELAEADVVVVVFDGSGEWTREDEAVLDATHHLRKVLLVNKTDLGKNPSVLRALARFSPVIHASALSGEGVGELQCELLRASDVSSDGPRSVMVTRDRHRVALDAAASAARRAARALHGEFPPDLVAVDIHVALDHVGEITGRTSAEEVLDRVFREFCIGK